MVPAFLTSVFLLALSTVSSAWPAPDHATILPRGAAPKESYDYVIVGGGTSGLTVGDRLTADGKYTVLVIEHGFFDNSSAILTGGGGGGMSPVRMYNITSAASAGLNNRRFSVGLGHCVGGSSAVNGMVFLRGTAEEYDMWGALGNKADTTWNWKGLLPYFKKGIYFTPPSQQFSSQLNVTYDMDAWGQESTTKIYATYSESGNGVTKVMYNAMAAMPGVEVPKDGAGGRNGLFWFTTSADPKQRTRSYARTGHWDGINRPNYEIVTGSRVNKILFDGTTATGVQFVPKAGGSATTVKANKEVILAAGSVHTPQVLQLSGIGPKSLLSQASIPLLVDLPGVGANFQDHSYIPNIGFSFGKQPPNTGVNVPNNGINNPNLGAFLGMPVVSPDNYQTIASRLDSQDPAAYLPSGSDPTVVAGYAEQKKLFVNAMKSKGVTFLQQFVGTPGGSVQNLHPLSRGTVYIDPRNIQADPIVDYRAMSNPIDGDVMAEHIKFMRRYMNSAPLTQYQPRESSPGTGVNTDAALVNWAKGQINPSVFHPIGTTAKMAREWGGVVDEDLFVYGTKKLSIIDGGIMPTTIGATTSMTVYAVAEKAADIIKARA